MGAASFSCKCTGISELALAEGSNIRLPDVFDHQHGGGSQFGQNSSYFRLTSFITIGGAEFDLYSLMYVDSQGNVRPIQRSFTPD